jgi:hypothetical protein
MDKQQIIDYLLYEKDKSVKLQIFEVSSVLRSIENIFKGQFGEIKKEPTIENLILLLNIHIDKSSSVEVKSYLISILRDFKINLVSR